MSLKYKPDFDRACKYWEAYWNHEIIDRPVVCVRSPKRGVVQANSHPYMAGADGDYKSAMESFDAYASTTYFGGEAIPFFDPSFGPDQFSAFLGARLVFGEGTNTSWAKPFVEDWKEASLELDESPGSAFSKMLELMRCAASHGQGKFLVGMLDLHSNMDCLSAIRGAENLCLDLMDCPDQVEAALNKVRSLYKPVYEKLFEAGNMESTGSIGWTPFYCKGKFATIECDFIYMLGPEHARRFVIPALAEEASFLDHCVFHLDGKEALKHLEDILAIKEIDAIQWVPGAGQPPTYEWMDLLKRIQKAGKGLHLYDWDINAIKRCYKELRPEGLVFEIYVKSQDEAEELLEWFRKNT